MILCKISLCHLTTDDSAFCVVGTVLMAYPNQSDSILPPVDSADLTAWTKHNKPGEFYAEIRMDEVVVQRTKAVRQSDVLFWDEKLPMYVYAAL